MPDQKLGVGDTMPQRQKYIEDLEGRDAGFSFSHRAWEHVETTETAERRPGCGPVAVFRVVVISYLEGRVII